MDWLTFFSSLIQSLAWPVTVVAAVIVLRRPLSGLIPLLQKFKYKDFEFEFGRRVDEVRAEVAREFPGSQESAPLPPGEKRALAKLAEVSPRAAVLEAWRNVELAALEAARATAGDRFRNRTLTYEAIRTLEANENLDRSVISALRDLRGLRNEAAHAPDFALSTEAALEYAEASEDVSGYLKAVAGGTTS